MNELCPCGSARPFAECCGLYLSGAAFPATAEALMRSRYAAHVKVNVPYLISTVAESRLTHHNPSQVNDFAENTDWLRLEIVDVVAGGPDDQKGIVEFRAWYLEGKDLQCMQERSRFMRESGQWRYLDGTYDGKPWRARIGRNDPCPCGSGKKLKKCHA